MNVIKNEIKSSSITPSQVLIELISQFRGNNDAIRLVSLCTSDGFNIYLSTSNELDSMPDKVAAISSTFSSVSNSISQEILSSELNVGVLETRTGCFLCVTTVYENHSAVLCVSASEKISLGELRLKTIRLSETIRDFNI